MLMRGKVKYKIWVGNFEFIHTSYDFNPEVTRPNVTDTSCNPQVRSSDLWATSLNPRVSSSSPQVRRLKASVARLKVWAD